MNRFFRAYIPTLFLPELPFVTSATPFWALLLGIACGQVYDHGRRSG